MSVAFDDDLRRLREAQARYEALGGAARHEVVDAEWKRVSAEASALNIAARAVTEATARLGACHAAELLARAGL